MKMLALVLVGAAAAVQLFPIVAAFRPTMLAALYAVTPPDETTRLLLRHRAVLLGLVGLALGVALAEPRLLAAAIGLALASKIAFLLLYAVSGAVTPATARVAAADAGTTVFLLVASLLLWRGD